ncbi:Conserved_hypothetical protein [Hexamita inflata]|uniref:Uncharacterized protein n=1 Tax=Hexamita inflata TaxID=28002 RepID=A0AA86Q1Q8_9EUKA|nr:Conserved hypothetical protein [Hexamita inflata]
MSSSDDPEPQADKQNDEQDKLTKYMFIHKLRPDIDIYCIISNNKLIIRNKTKQYAEHDLSSQKFEYFEECMHFFYAIPHNGQLYLKFGSALFILNKNKIEEYTDNTNIVLQNQMNDVDNVDHDDSSSASYSAQSEKELCALFSFNNKLYMRHGDAIYVKEQDGFRFAKNIDGFCFQFCNNIYIFDANNDHENIKLYKLKYNLDTELILHFNKLEKISLVHGGVIICYNYDITYFIDMMSSKVVQRPTEKCFEFEEIHALLELGDAGLQLKREILISIFGEDFPNQLKQCYNSYIQDQINNYPIYSQNCNQLLPFSVLHQYFFDLDLERKDKIKNGIVSLTSKISKQEEYLNVKLEIASQLLNQAVSQFKRLSNVEACQ